MIPFPFLLVYSPLFFILIVSCLPLLFSLPFPSSGGLPAVARDRLLFELPPPRATSLASTAARHRPGPLQEVASPHAFAVRPTQLAKPRLDLWAHVARISAT